MSEDDIYASVSQDRSYTATMYNTGTIYDLIAGKYSMGSDGHFHLNGGLGPFITGSHGYGNTFKSTVLDSLIAGAMRIIKTGRAWTIDTEGSKDKDRCASFNWSLLNSEEGSFAEEIEDRMTFKSGADMDINAMFADMQALVDVRLANKKKLMKDSPFLCPKTGIPLKVWDPAFYFIDSFSEAESSEEGDMLKSKKGFEDGKNKTIWLVDGNKKTLLIRAMRKMAEKAGICFICVAQTGGNVSMDSYAPVSKQLPDMKQKDAFKGVGKKFEYLTHLLYQTTLCTNLHDGQKTALYKQGKTPDNDLKEIVIHVQRNKSGKSGQVVPFVISQDEGMLNGITNLHYIRKVCTYAGLDGGSGKAQHSLLMYPDVKFSRNTVRDKMDGDYKLNRAMELTARFLYIQNNWNLSKLPPGFQMTVEELVSAVTSSGKDWNEILETTGYWTFEKTDRKYLSIMDIVAALPID